MPTKINRGSKQILLSDTFFLQKEKKKLFLKYIYFGWEIQMTPLYPTEKRNIDNYSFAVQLLNRPDDELITEKLITNL